MTIKTPSTAPVSAPKLVFGGGGKVGTLTVEWKVRPGFYGLFFTWGSSVVV